MFIKQHAGPEAKRLRNSLSPGGAGSRLRRVRQIPGALLVEAPAFVYRRMNGEDQPGRCQSEIDSGTLPRKRPVTHDRFRSTVAGATDVSRLQRGVALKPQGRLKRRSGMIREAGRLRKSNGLGWQTLKGTKTEERCPVQPAGHSVLLPVAREQLIEPDRPRQDGNRWRRETESRPW
jgi:hypothetical protein